MEQDYIYEATFDIEDFRGALCLGAVDLSETTDLACAKALLMKPDDSRKYILTKYFIPEEKLERSDDTGFGARYAEWARAGLLTIQPGNDLDLSGIADWYYSLYQDYGIRLYKCGYDQRFAKDFLKRMDEYGFEYEMILQNAITMSNATKLVEAELKSQNLNYNENEMDRWCFGNASIKVDNFGNVLIVKVKDQHGRRIDGAVTLAILIEMFRRNKSDFIGSLQ
jgi:phage terminase large subunit-like protein